MFRLALTGVVLAFVCSAAAAETDELTRMERAIDARVANGQFMGAVLVARDGKPILNKGYGKANLEWQVPNTPATKFRLASLTKQFTAAGILLLEERGKLKVEDPVKKHMPDAPAAWDQITIFHLLTHTSGIHNYTDLPDFQATKTRPMTPEKLIALFRDSPLDFPPGTDWSYSNSGYVLLGYLIERLSGEPYGQFIQNNIFRPLGMKDSGYDSNTEVIERHATGYVPGPNGTQVAGFLDMTIPFAAGGLYSTTEDLLRWEQALFGGKLLSSASLKKMTTPFKKDYALGLGVQSAPDGKQIVAHSGGIDGFNTELTYVPAEKLTVAVLANLNGPAANQIAADLRKIALHESVAVRSDRVSIPLSSASLDQLTGPYQSADSDGVITVSRKDDHLLTQGLRPSLDLYPQSETEFFSKSEDVDVKFEKDTGGESTSFVLNERGQNHRFIRISDQKAKQIAEALAKRVRDQAAAPGSEAALRRSIAEIVAGQPDYSQMSEGLATAVRQQLPQLQPIFQKWGAIQSVTFKGVGPLGADIYNVTFANGSAEFRITMAADGKISGQRMRPLP